MTKENIKEQRIRGGGVSTASSISKVGSGGSGGRNNPTTKTPIRKIDPKQFDNRSAAVTTNTPTGGSLKAGSFGISKAGRDQAAQNRAEFKAKIDAVKASSNTSSSSMSARDKFKSKFIKKDKGVGFVKRGTPGAQRAENKEKARLRAQAMAKARIEAKKKAAEMANEEITPYEEANYVMMQLDEENIQEIVKAGLGAMKAIGKFGAKSPLHFAGTLATTAAVAPTVGKLAYKATKTAGNVINKITNFDPIGDARKENIKKKQREYEKKSGTTKDDGYFYDPTIDKKG